MLTSNKGKPLGQQLQEAQAEILKRHLNARFQAIRQALWDKISKGLECQVRVTAHAEDETPLKLWANTEELYIGICKTDLTRFDIDVVLPCAHKARELITVLIRPRN